MNPCRVGSFFFISTGSYPHMLCIIVFTGSKVRFMLLMSHFVLAVFYMYSHLYYLVLSIQRFQTCNSSFFIWIVQCAAVGILYFCTFISSVKNIFNLKNLDIWVFCGWLLVLACWFCFLCAFLLLLLFFLLLFLLLFFGVAVSCTNDVFFQHTQLVTVKFIKLISLYKLSAKVLKTEKLCWKQFCYKAS